MFVAGPVNTGKYTASAHVPESPWQKLSLHYRANVMNGGAITIVPKRTINPDKTYLSKTNGWWSDDVEGEALPTVFRKVIEMALAGGG